MQKLVLALLLVTVSQIGFAQDDLLSLVDKTDSIKKDLTFLQRLIDKLQEQDFETSDQYEKAKYIAFKIMNYTHLPALQIYLEPKKKF